VALGGQTPRPATCIGRRIHHFSHVVRPLSNSLLFCIFFASDVEFGPGGASGAPRKRLETLPGAPQSLITFLVRTLQASFNWGKPTTATTTTTTTTTAAAAAETTTTWHALA
jgi:hypothetical protein